MKLKINKLMPYSEENKKYKTLPVNINNRNYYLSPHPLDKHNYAGVIIPLNFVCTMPDQNNDYEYLNCNIRVEYTELRETVAKSESSYKDIKRHEGKREFLFQFVPPYRGAYSIFIEMLYKQKYFIQTSQPPQELRQTSIIQLHCDDPFSLEENIIYEEKPFSIAFPLYVQYTLTNRLKDDILDLQMNFKSESFDHIFENEQTKIRLGGGETYYAMLRISPKTSINKMDLLFAGGNLMLGTYWLFQNKNKLEKKLVIRSGFKHLLFRAQAIDKKVVKQDIVEVRVKFINSYEMDYNIGPIKISINEQDIPPGIKLLKTSRDTIQLMDKSEEVVTLTMICLRSGFFQFKGITLNIKDKHNPKEERILKYINDITFVVQNQQADKQVDVMERTTKVEVQELL